jgi:hypothetical protein
MVSKLHIQRVERSTNNGDVPLSLCGLSRNADVFRIASQATCERCIKIYADNNSMVPMLARRVKEIRTTSSTGGQKGVKEAQYSLIPVGPLEELAVLFGRGARKYARHQWRNGYEWSKSYDAILRHQNAFWAGKDYDVCSNDLQGCQHVDAEGKPFDPPAPDTCYNHTGAHHMTAVAWHAFVLLEFKETHPDHDDRYILPKE